MARVKGAMMTRKRSVCCRTSKLENNIFHIGGKHNGKS